jgi:hypothetical protein
MTLPRKITAPAGAAVTGSDGYRSKDFSRSCADHHPPPTTAYQPPPLLRATSLRPRDPAIHRNQTRTTSRAVAAAATTTSGAAAPATEDLHRAAAARCTAREETQAGRGGRHPTPTRRTSCQIRRLVSRNTSRHHHGTKQENAARAPP